MAAMIAVDRGRYCHEDQPYLDRPRRIGFNVTISAPHMVNLHGLQITIYLVHEIGSVDPKK